MPLYHLLLLQLEEEPIEKAFWLPRCRMCLKGWLVHVIAVKKGTS